MSTKIINEPTSLILAKNLEYLISRDSEMTPSSLARKLGIPTNKITRILNGDVTDPKASTLLQIAQCFGISIDQLLGHEPMVHGTTATDTENTLMLPVYNLSSADSSRQPKEWYRWVENEVAGDYFSLHVNTDLYEPTFPKGSLLIINSELKPEDRSFVVVAKEDNPAHMAIKKYVVDGDQIYLYPINPKLAIDNFKDSVYKISGVILEVHQKLPTGR
ncbi:TPA: helix-turn-helix domain-containing protein [Legionella pneumophila]